LACLELGASDYVLKPFRSDDEIMESVADAIRRLERWKGVIRETVLRLSDSSALSHPN
jgi:DNA-binding response OmpR family regulator